MKRIYIAISLAFIAFLSACTSPQHQASSTGIKLGKPYQIDGRVYSPTYNPAYDETGVASWYGPGFNGGRTASGEHYDQEDITAAHKTLPLPSIVRVTNLDNGRVAIVRINDRGPFVGDRLIDLSHGAAMKLGIIKHGTAHVRVQFLDAETREYVSNMPGGVESLKRLDMFAKAGSGRAFNPNDIMVTDVAPVNAPTQKIAIASNTTPHTTVNNQPLPFFADPPYAAPLEKHIAVAQTTTVKPVAYVTPVNPITPHVETDTARVPSISVAVTGEKFADATQSLEKSYFIQAGTFGVKDNADRMLSALQEIGKAKIVEKVFREKKLYRVLAGPFNTRADAENILSRLDTVGISGAKIIRD